MTVYVDPLFRSKRRNWEGVQWCHMMADSAEELHHFAASIGLARCWFHQGHYDITPSRRALAIVHGAVETTARDMARRRSASRTPRRGKPR